MKPFRWDLSRREQLGGLVAGRGREFNPVTVDEIVTVAAKIVARSDNGQLYFVGRSLHTVFDLLSGLFAGTDYSKRIHLLPLSIRLADYSDLVAPRSVQAFRELLNDVGITMPMAPGERVTFVDFVDTGDTFGFLAETLVDWAAELGLPLSAVQPKLRFVGAVGRERTSPKTWRWVQHRNWAYLVPDSQIKNVSIDMDVLAYLASGQNKTNGPHVAERWAKPEGANHDEATLDGLAEAVSWYDCGRLPETKAAFARVITAEPTIRERWLRSLVP